MSAFLVGSLDGRLKVARIVQRIKDADHVDAVCHGLLNEVLHRVVGVGTVAQHILAAEQHLQLLMRQFFAQDAQAFPRIFIEEADAGVKGGAAPAFNGEIRDLVHLGQDRAHLIHRHTGCEQRLVCIAQNDLGNFNRFLSQCHSPSLSISSWCRAERRNPPHRPYAHRWWQWCRPAGR